MAVWNSSELGGGEGGMEPETPDSRGGDSLSLQSTALIIHWNKEALRSGGIALRGVTCFNDKAGISPHGNSVSFSTFSFRTYLSLCNIHCVCSCKTRRLARGPEVNLWNLIGSRQKYKRTNTKKKKWSYLVCWIGLMSINQSINQHII